MACSSGCNCTSTSVVTTTTTCPEICTSLAIQNAWNIPACNASAVLSVTGLTTLLIGTYLYNPEYGWFRVTAFDSVNYQITVLNECFGDNAAAGTVVPAGTQFVFGAPPSATQVYFTGYSSGTGYGITGVQSPIVFGTTSPTITITSPGTYLISGGINYGPNGCTSSNQIAIYLGLKRTNNTATVIANRAVGGFEPLTAVTGVMGTGALLPYIYTTTNSDDVLTLVANYTGTITSGTLAINDAVLIANKLF